MKGDPGPPGRIGLPGKTVNIVYINRTECGLMSLFCIGARR